MTKSTPPVGADAMHVCIHGHFYQPPRENPWLEEIEREESAAPAHDWNERIAAECYRPNAASPILDDKGQIAALVNNYRHMSFNFGPTLLRWLERHARPTYQAILEADRASARENHGHGNAIAQAYNHVILPLANTRDKHTQVRWGARDFELRFGRKPEGMWLAETACDAETLAVLAENHIAFTVLSPYQAKSWRPLDGRTQAEPCADGSIPTGRAYLYQVHSGRPLHLFFYDGAIAKGIAFEHLLSDASHVVGAFTRAHDRRPIAGEPWLVHTATDGESYGHHSRFGDMALAASFARLVQDPRVRLTNYGSFLAQNAVRAEADIKDVSAWSCAHGVGRWSADCGCNMGGGPGWNQRWRAHLRRALDVLRDALAGHFEAALGEIVRDPWEVRDAYIDVVFDRSQARPFFDTHRKRGVGDDRIVDALRLLEMQRAALLMYTSCGWFFDDVSGPESVILMRYAARAIDLARATGARDAEPAFLDALRHAESNVRGADGVHLRGDDIYRRQARTAAVSADSVVVSYALRALSERGKRSPQLYGWRVSHHEERKLAKGAVPCVVGRVVVEDERTLESHDRIYALAHFGGLDFRCSLRPFRSEQELQEVSEHVRRVAVEGNTQSIVRALDELFGTDARSLKDAFADLRQAAARAIGREKMEVLAVVGKEMLESHRALLVALRDLGVGLPPHVATLAAFVLSTRADALTHELIGATDDEDAADVEMMWRALSAQLGSVMEEAHALGVAVDFNSGARALVRALVERLCELEAQAHGPGLADRVARVHRLADACALIGVAQRDPDLVDAVFSLFEHARQTPALADALAPYAAVLEALDKLCGSRFSARVAAALPGHPLTRAFADRLTVGKNSTA
jgi:alpha-amylase/alpha-mannosidase (GH57 family)